MASLPLPADLSPLLRGIAELELSLGNEVFRVDVNQWSNCPLCIVFSRPLHFGETESRLKIPGEVIRWKNTDTHYSLEEGYVCKQTRHSLSGPLIDERRETMAEGGISSMAKTISDVFQDECRNTLDACFSKIVHCLNQLADSDLHWRPFPAQNSICNIILHLCGNTRQWIIAPITNAPNERDRPAEFADRRDYTRQELIDRLSAAVADCKAAIKGMPAERLLETQHIQEWDVTLLTALFSSVSHFVGHTHQIIYITRLRLGDSYRFHWTPNAPAQGTVPA